MENSAQDTKMHSPLPACPKCGSKDYRNSDTRTVAGQGVTIYYFCRRCSGEFVFRFKDSTLGVFFYVENPTNNRSWMAVTEFMKFFALYWPVHQPTLPNAPRGMTIFHQPEEDIWNQLT